MLSTLTSLTESSGWRDALTLPAPLVPQCTPTLRCTEVTTLRVICSDYNKLSEFSDSKAPVPVSEVAT